MLTDDLKAPISWEKGDVDIQRFLELLQGNILKGHGRNHTVNLFCHFRDDAKDEARAFMRRQVQRMKSAKQQLEATAEKRKTGRLDTDPFVCIFLTKAGYDYFEVPDHKQPSDPTFRSGMHSTPGLNDPPRENWSPPLRDPHVLVLIGLMTADEADDEATSLLNQNSIIGDVAHNASGDVIGGQYFNSDGNGIENFGYVDGRSQPLVLTEDITSESAEVSADPNHDGHKRAWPVIKFPVDQFVVRDAGVDDDKAYGSYFVFRSLSRTSLASRAQRMRSMPNVKTQPYPEMPTPCRWEGRRMGLRWSAGPTGISSRSRTPFATTPTRHAALTSRTYARSTRAQRIRSAT